MATAAAATVARRGAAAFAAASSVTRGMLAPTTAATGPEAWSSTLRLLTSSSSSGVSPRHVQAAAYSAAPPSPQAYVLAPTTSEALIEEEEQFGAHNYHPLPVVFNRAQGVHVWDPEGKRYLDCLSAYSAVNQGHCHPRILEALKEQAEMVTLSSRAFFNSRFPPFAKYVTEFFQYDMVLPMNTGAEAVETALKLAKKWGSQVKGIPRDQAMIVSCCNCFHGRTMAAVSMSCDPDATADFHPMLPGQLKVEHGDAEGLERVFQEHGPRIAAFILEPIQGEAGVIVPPSGYLRKVRELCTKHNVLMIADEVQTGIARTGAMLAVDHENVRPDIVVLGKALSGGVVPVSAVLADKEIMLTIQPNQHGSTFGGNPVSSAVAVAALQVVLEEQLADRAQVLGELTRGQLNEVAAEVPDYVEVVRGKGLLNAFVLKRNCGVEAWDVCMRLKERGVLAKPTHRNIIRFTPPLVITPSEVHEATSALRAVMTEDLHMLKKAALARGVPKAPKPCERCGRVRDD